MIRRREFMAGAAIAPILAVACTPKAAAPAATVTEAPFGDTPDGPATLYTLTNANGVTVGVTNFGAIVTSVKVPDRTGAMADVVLGYADVAGYVSDRSSQGATIGRYGNRIGGAKFDLGGKTYNLAANDGPNSLHGGARGFNKYLWAATTATEADRASVILTRTSPDGEEGYPGNLAVEVTFSLTNANELVIHYKATTDKATPINLTNHCYWNLKGEGEGDILAHKLAIAADNITPVGPGLIPTGVLMPVEGTPFDFRNPTAIGARIDADNPQLKLGGGYDHNWALNAGIPPTPVLAARLEEESTGRIMEVRTTEPGLQFYTGNFLDGTIIGKSGKSYQHRGALCLETQHFPDSPNKPVFPSTILQPGATYDTTTIYAFSAA